MPKSVPKSIQTCFRVFFLKKFYARCSLEGRVFKNFQKTFFSKFQKCPKSFPKVSKRVLNVFWGKFFDDFFAQCSAESRIFQNFQKNIFSKFQKCPKSFPKVSKRVLNLLWVKFFKIFCPVFHGVSSLRNFSKKSKKVSNFLKCPKSFPKVSKRVLNVFWGKVFEKILPSFPWKVESSKVFEKKSIFKIPKMPKSVPKSIQTCFMVIFSKKIYAQCSMEGRVFENFQKKSKNLQNSKKAQNRSQKYPNVF